MLVFRRLLLLLALCVSCSDDHFELQEIAAPMQPALLSAAGCWTVVEGDEAMRNGVLAGRVIQLDTTRFHDIEGQLTLSILPFDSIRYQLLTYRSAWGVDAGDPNLLHAWIGNGLKGQRFRLRQRGDTLAGDHSPFTDTDGFLPRQRYRVRAIRSPCPASR